MSASHTLHLTSLPDELLVKILSKLPPADRHAALPLACRRLHSLLYSPRLLRDVSIVVTPSGSQEVQSLLSWLVARCAGHMQRLYLYMGMELLEQDEVAQADLAAQLPAALAACGAAGGLAEMTAVGYSDKRTPPLLIGSWAAALRGLTRLDLYWSGELHITAPLHRCEVLDSLRLSGRPVRVAAATSLPPALSELSIGASKYAAGHALPLPPQIASLRQLHSFELLRWCWENRSEDASHGWRPLEALSATLQRLCLLDVVLLPPNLGHLTALTKLAIRFSTCNVSTIGRLDADNQGILEAALPQLRRLASLDVAPVGSGLQQLPPGSWLNSLRTLVVPLGAATASLPVLAAATGLRRFGLSAGDKPVKMEEIQSLLQWAAGSPALQHLTLQQRQFDCDTVSTLLRLQRSRPELTVQTEECVDVP